MATEIAKAYVQIVPSMQGIQAQLSKSLAPAVETSGKESGQKMGNAQRKPQPWDSVRLRRLWRRSVSRR